MFMFIMAVLTAVFMGHEAPPARDYVPHGGLLMCIACPSYCLGMKEQQ